MKKLYWLLLTAACTLAFAGCSDDDDTAAPVLEIVTSDIGFDAAGGTGAITLRTTEAAVTAVSDKGWLTVTGTTSTAISFAVAESTEALQRSANLTITAGGLSHQVTILQNGALFDIGSEPVAIDPTGVAATSIKYDTSMTTRPTVTVPSDASWLTAAVEESSIRLSAELNYTGARSTTITITQGWKPVEIVVNQDMVDLLDTKTIDRDRDLAEITVTPTEYLALAASLWDVRTNDSWITLAKTDDSFTVSLSENTSGALRHGTVELVDSDGNVLTTVAVSQKIFSYRFFLGTWTMNYGSNQAVSVTLAENPDDASSYIMTGLSSFTILIGYEDRGETAALTITCPQYMGRYNYNNGQADIFLLPTTTSGTSFNTSEGIGYDCIFNLNESSQVLTPQRNAATTVTINGLIFAGQNTVSGSWVNFGNYHPLTSFTRSGN